LTADDSERQYVSAPNGFKGIDLRSCIRAGTSPAFSMFGVTPASRATACDALTRVIASERAIRGRSTNKHCEVHHEALVDGR
jgi:hypothetical protein